MRFNAQARKAWLLGALLLVASATNTKSIEHPFTDKQREQSHLTDESPTHPLSHSLDHHRDLAGTVGEWKQLGNRIEGEEEDDGAGSSVVMSRDGNFVAIGSSAPDEAGHVRVFKWDGSQWIQLGANIDPIGTEPPTAGSPRLRSQEFGRSGHLTMSGDGLRVAVGVDNADIYDESLNRLSQAGYAAVFDWNGTAWENSALFMGTGANENIGDDVSLSDNGRRLAVQSRRRLEVFELFGGSWNLLGSIEHDGGLGFPVTISGNGERVVAWSRLGGPAGFEVFEWNGSVWNRVGNKVNSFLDQSLSFSFSGDRVALAGGRTHLRVYDLVGTSWSLTVNTPRSEFGPQRLFMSSDGLRFLVIYFLNNNPDFARVFKVDGSSFVQVGQDLSGEVFGEEGAISADGQRVAIVTDIFTRRDDGYNDASGKVRVFEFGSTDGSFPENFNQVVCAYADCLGNLIPKYAARTFSNTTLNEYATTSKWKAKQAKRTIETGGFAVMSVRRLRESMKFIELARGAAPNFANNIGRSGSTCAIDFVEDFISAFEGTGILEDSLLNSMRRTRLAAAKTSRGAKEWRSSVGRCLGAIWIMMNELGEKQVPLCEN